MPIEHPLVLDNGREPAPAADGGHVFYQLDPLLLAGAIHARLAAEKWLPFEGRSSFKSRYSNFAAGKSPLPVIPRKLSVAGVESSVRDEHYKY